MWWTATLQVLPKVRQFREMHANATPATIASVANPKLTIPALNVGSIVPQGRLASVLHLHYPELWPELREALASIPERFDLFVSVTEGAAEKAIPQIKASYPDAHVSVFPNHGRDILPFMTFAATGVLNNYDLICKLHAKRTIHREDGDAWRRALLGGVLRDRNRVHQIIAAFELIRISALLLLRDKCSAADLSTGLIIGIVSLSSGHASVCRTWQSEQHSLVVRSIGSAPSS